MLLNFQPSIRFFSAKNNQLWLARREEYNGQTQTAGLELRPFNLENKNFKIGGKQDERKTSQKAESER